MIDIKLIRETPGLIKQNLLKKGVDYSVQIDRILQLDVKRRTIITESESNKAEQNKVSKQIPQMKKDGIDTVEVFEQLNKLKEKIRSADDQLREVETELDDLLLRLPNLPDEDVVSGGKENNETLRIFGEPFAFVF